MQGWLAAGGETECWADAEGTPMGKKMPEVGRLENYRAKPPEQFWAAFPTFKPRKLVPSQVHVGRLAKLIRECWDGWDQQQKKDAKSALSILKRGARTFLTKKLPGMEQKNAASAYEEGEMMTDNIAHWVKKKFVAGPYRRRPYRQFRVNPLMAVRQRNKVRPVLNLSAPRGESFNDAVHEPSLKRLTMSTAKQFGQAVRRAGKNAVMAKYDISDAYKLIPGRKSQWRHFRFK